MTNTLYHSGLSGDVLAVVTELIEQDGMPEIFAVGFSMGGNLVLKMAGELGVRRAGRIAGGGGGGSGAGLGGVRGCSGRAEEFYL